MQLVLDFVETNDCRTRLTVVWEALEPEQRAALVTILARLMARAVDPTEDDDE